MLVNQWVDHYFPSGSYGFPMVTLPWGMIGEGTAHRAATTEAAAEPLPAPAPTTPEKLVENLGGQARPCFYRNWHHKQF